ncbi:MAG: hypothetical protein ACLVEL_11715 [Ruthenibacterium sp.]
MGLPGFFALVCLSETATPGCARKSKKNYIVKKPSGRIEAAAGQLHQQSPEVFSMKEKDIGNLQHTA